MSKRRTEHAKHDHRLADRERDRRLFHSRLWLGRLGAGRFNIGDGHQAPATRLGAWGLSLQIPCPNNGGKDRMCIVDKRATMCADYAYSLPDPVPVGRVKNAIDAVIANNPELFEQALNRKPLMGWFVGQP